MITKELLGNIVDKNKVSKLETAGLSDEQIEFVLTREEHVLALASAGAGKTFSLIHFINDKIQEGAKPNEIISFSFTRKAANELKDRVNEFFKNEKYSFDYMSTIHSFCWNELIKPYFEEIGYTVLPTIIHEFPDEFMNKEYKEYGNKMERGPFNKRFSQTVSKDLQHEDFTDPQTIRLLEYIVTHNLVMFDFMIHLAIFVLSTDDTYDRVYNTFKNVKYIITDEAQDLNPPQYYFLKKLRDVTGG